MKQMMEKETILACSSVWLSSFCQFKRKFNPALEYNFVLKNNFKREILDVT